MARFGDEQIRRYSRQILLREVGGRGQEQLQAARPVLVCAGEVGHLTAEYLWRAGLTELTLLAATPELAAALSAQLGRSGYPGCGARALAEAAPAVAQLARAAPDFTLLWLPAAAPAASDLGSAPLLWACCRGSAGVVGQGAAALLATASRQQDCRAAASGAAAMTVGSALALLAMQRVLGLGGADAPWQRPGALWQLDLDAAQLPQWQL